MSDSVPWNATGSRFCYDPYSIANPLLLCGGCERTADVDLSGTLHAELAGSVTFVPFPQNAVTIQAHSGLPKEEMVRLFIGQLPYEVTNMELFWICTEFGANSQIFHTQRIMKKGRGKKRVPTGCVHTYVDPRDVDVLIERLHRRLLFDETGVWWAANEAEADVLHEYCRMLVMERQRRKNDRSRQPITVQLATTTYERETPDPFWEESSVTSALDRMFAERASTSSCADESERSDFFPSDYREALSHMFMDERPLESYEGFCTLFCEPARSDDQRGAKKPRTPPSDFHDSLRLLFNVSRKDGGSDGTLRSPNTSADLRDCFARLFKERGWGEPRAAPLASAGSLPDYHHPLHRLFKEPHTRPPARDTPEGIANLFTAAGEAPDNGGRRSGPRAGTFEQKR